MKLSSKRVSLKLLDINDFEAWKEAYRQQLDPQNVWDRAHRPQELTKTKFKQLLAAQKKKRQTEKSYEYAVFRKDTKELIGFVMAMDVIRTITHSAYLGYTFFNRHWGQGLASEAIRVFFKIAFTDLKLHRLQAGIEPKNTRSLKVARSLKMRKEGLSKRVVFIRNEWQDLVQFAITSEEVKIKWKGESTRSY